MMMMMIVMMIMIIMMIMIDRPGAAGEDELR